MPCDRGRAEAGAGRGCEERLSGQAGDRAGRRAAAGTDQRGEIFSEGAGKQLSVNRSEVHRSERSSGLHQPKVPADVSVTSFAPC